MRTIPPETACHHPGDTPPQPQTIVALGIGNLLWADEGFGVRCIEALQRRYEFAEHVSLIDGGTQGLYLIQHVQAADALLIFDAIDYGLEPGTLRLIRDDDVPRFMGAKKMSLHQTGFSEVLALAELSGQGPAQLALVGVQPVQLEDYGGSLTEPVRAQLPAALTHACRILASWGVTLTPRSQPVQEGLHDASLALSAYEQGRPSAADACRVGDARVLAQREA